MTDLAAVHARATARLAELYPMIRGGLLTPAVPDHGELIPLAARVLSHYRTVRGSGDEAFEHGLESFARTSFDFLRLQARFMRTGRYRATDSGAINEALYQSSEKMEGYYLDGLLLTYAFWPNHTRLFRFFLDGFLGRTASDANMVEIGVGHGLMGVTAMQALTEGRYTGVDISPASLDYTRRHAERASVPASRYALIEGNALDPNLDLPPQDAAVCCEVLEHVERPDLVLAGLRALLRPGGRAFVTTVANLEAEDHVYLYNDADHIRRELGEAGFQIERELVLTLDGFAHPTIVPLNYAAVLVRPD